MNNNCIGSLKVTLVNIIELGRNEYMIKLKRIFVSENFKSFVLFKIKIADKTQAKHEKRHPTKIDSYVNL